MATRSRDYQRLIDRILSHEPRAGYSLGAQIPELSESELATVVKHESTVLADACCGEALLESVIASLTEEGFNSIERAAMIGAAITGAVRAQARRYLLEEIQTEVARREEREQEIESELRHAHDPRHDDYGVNNLFVGA